MPTRGISSEDSGSSLGKEINTLSRNNRPDTFGIFLVSPPGRLSTSFCTFTLAVTGPLNTGLSTSSSSNTKSTLSSSGRSPSKWTKPLEAKLPLPILPPHRSRVTVSPVNITRMLKSVTGFNTLRILNAPLSTVILPVIYGLAAVPCSRILPSVGPTAQSI